LTLPLEEATNRAIQLAKRTEQQTMAKSQAGKTSPNGRCPMSYAWCPMSDSRCSMVRFMVKRAGEVGLARWLNCQVCSMRDKFNSYALAHTHTPSFWQQDLATGCRHSVGPPIRGSHRMAKGCCIGQVRVCRLIALEIACDETYGLCKEDVAVTRRYLPG